MYTLRGCEQGDFSTMYCNKCGAALLQNVWCSNCRTLLPQPSPFVDPRKTQLKRARRWAIVIIVLFGCIGILWDVLAAVILFRTYSFFESVVVCLLVMILCAVAAMRADFEVWSGIFRSPDAAKEADPDNATKRDLIEQLRSQLKVLFYAIAFLMALVRLVLALFE